MKQSMRWPIAPTMRFASYITLFSRRRIYLFLALWALMIIVTEANSENECDELKCRSMGKEGYGYDCFGSAIDPFLCDDDYVAINLTTVDPIKDNGGYSYYYYTCCPPNITIDNSTLPQCSPTFDPCDDFFQTCWADSPLNPMTCNDPEYKYVGQTGARHFNFSWNFQQFRCCRTESVIDSSIIVPEIIRVVLSYITFFLSLSILLGIVLSSSARGQAFNVYLVLLEIPNLLFSVMNIIFGTASILQVSLPGQCGVYTFIGNFEMTTCISVNAVICYEILNILVSSKQCRRVPAPSIRKVLIQGAIAYVYAALMSLIPTFSWCNEVVREFLRDNRTIAQVIYSLETVFGVYIPFLYIIYVAIRVARFKLLPTNGRYRVLAIYFYRITIIFTTVIPIIFTLQILTPIVKFPGVSYMHVYFISFMIIISDIFMLAKPDVRKGTINVCLCKCFTKDRDLAFAANPRATIGLWFGFRPSMFAEGEETDETPRRHDERATTAGSTTIEPDA